MGMSRVTRVLLGTVVTIVTSIYIEEFLSGYGRTPPINYREYLFRALACFVGSAVGYVVAGRGSFLVLAPACVFYLWSDRVGVLSYGSIDAHPVDWYPFSYPSHDFVWLTSLLAVSVIGLFAGRFIAAVVQHRIRTRRSQPA
jgi:hypothetical protein